MAGCLGGVLGVMGAYAITPSVPPTKLLGKSPEYVAHYTTTYQSKVKKDRTTSAVGGCIFGTVITTVAYAVILVPTLADID